MIKYQIFSGFLKPSFEGFIFCLQLYKNERKQNKIKVDEPVAL